MLRAIVACLLALLTKATANVYVYTVDTPHTIAQEFPDMPATFGGEVPLTGLRGLLVQGEPEDGCSALPPPPQVTDNFTGKWIVLLARFNCSFEIKIRNAQAAGYDCAIVHNVNSSELETMSAKNPDGIVIPSTFVSDKTGEVLIEAYLYTFGNYYIMLDGISPYNINSLLVPFAVVVVLCLIVILIFMIIKCIKDRRRARRHRLPNRFLKKIPTCKFSKGDPYDTCAICLDDYQEGERLRVLPCAHAYHSKCIDPWLTQNRRVCPVCKRRVLAAGEPRARSDSDSDTEPLLADSDRAPTQGGTFDEQRENPFVRAVRHMVRLRERHERGQDAESAQPSEETEQTNNGENASVEAEETQSLVARTERRSRRSRRARRAQARQNPSINSETRGEIGVAALPVSPADATPQHMIL
ncbi:PREDICTED: E3 ubiquitin-protein ligase RNF13 [Papilio xuthus]|uniref:E3 ubiquitin-protein ligase RNF13 n=1 Tax=Papilio xuthus TaxID=66420 RepID=A0AAJ7E5I0_PAPXU|nr:PREDICTED: E3 ubiquitin-protein ligase RNF13 [Papilio xuthus]